MGIDGADAVGTEQPHALRVRHLDTVLFQRRALRADLPKPRSGYDRGMDAAPAAFFDGLWCDIRRDDEDRQVDRVGDVCEAGMDGSPEEFAALLPHEMDRAAVTALREIARYAVTEFFR